MLDGLISIVWLLVNGQLLFASWRWSRQFFPGDRWWQITGHTVLLSYATVVLVQTILGAAGLLYPWLSLAIVALLSSLALFRLGHRRAALGDAITELPGSAHEAVNWEDRAWVFIWVFVLWCWLGLVLVNGLLTFPTDFDTLAYHLPLPVFWWQGHSLYAPDTLYWSVPANNELITLWIIGPFSGDFLYALTNLPAAILLACGTMEIAYRIGLSAPFRNLAGLAAATNPIVLRQLSTCENDVATAGVFFICLGYVLRHAEGRHTYDLGLGSVALGLLAGMKYYALGYACVAILCAFFAITRQQGRRATLRASAAGLWGLIVFGGYWYARNFVVSGSPLYPVGGRVDGDDGAPFYPAVWQSTFAGNGSSELMPLALEAILSLMGLWFWVAFVTLPISVLGLCVERLISRRFDQTDLSTTARLTIVFAAMGAFAVLIVTPFAVEDDPGTLWQLRAGYCPVRYGLIFLSLANLCLIILFNDIIRACLLFTERDGRPRQRCALFATSVRFGPYLACALFLVLQSRVFNSIHFREKALVAAINGFLVTALAYLLLSSWPKKRRWIVPIGLGVLALSLGVALEYRSTEWRVAFDQVWSRNWVCLRRQFTQNESEGRIYVFEACHYAMLGPCREAHVCYLKPTLDLEWLKRTICSKRVTVLSGSSSQKQNRRTWEVLVPWILERPDVFRPIPELDAAFDVDWRRISVAQ